MVRPRSAATASARRRRCTEVVPSKKTSAPYERVPSTLTAGAVSGITTTAGRPRARAAHATAWAWLPDE